MKKIVHYCDTCGLETHEDNLKCFTNFDICKNCQIKIINKIIKNKLITLRPYCQKCKGTGKIDQNDYEYDRIVHNSQHCDHCTL